METNSIPQLDQVTEYAGRALTWLVTSPIEIVGVAVLIVLGYAVKMIPKFPNGWIPITVIVSGIVLYAFGFPPSRAPQIPIEPRLWMGMVGFLAAMASWVIHRTVLKRWIDPKIFDADGNTIILRKEDAPKPGDSG